MLFRSRTVWPPGLCLPLLAVALTAAGMIGSPAMSARAAEPETASRAKGAAAAKTVQMVIDFGDGVEIHFTRLPWKAGMTVGDAIKATAGQPHGPKFSSIGSDETLQVMQIGDLKNEGRGRESRNWLYRINGNFADVGAGIQELKAGDRVLWNFERFDYNRAGSK